VSESGLDDWVLTDPVPGVARRVAAIRLGNPAASLPPRPAAAMRILLSFALKRPVDDLLASPDCFEQLDAMAVLTNAALGRPAEEAARLAILQWRKETERDPNETPLTAGIVHDVASQRTALQLAAFIRECRREPETGLAEQTLRVFAGAGSGRTNLDKALLYFTLRDDGCEGEAAELLTLTLREMGERAQGLAHHGPEELHDLVGALHHLSPSQRILEDWITEAMKDPLDLAATVNLVANLLAGVPRGAESLAEYVGATWDHHDLVQVCGLLVGRAPQACETLRAILASRSDFKFLAEIIIEWHKSPTLSKSTKNLIAAVVERGADRGAGPRPKGDIDRIHANLTTFGAPAECLRMLRVAAAVHIEGRSGEQMAELLQCVDSRRERRITARMIGERLADRVLRSRTAADKALFVDYIKALHDRGEAESAYWPLRELPDPMGADQALDGAATVIGEIASSLYAVHLDEAGFNLLERCLENEQWVTPRDVADVVVRLRESGMPAGARHDLLSATVGRWSEVLRRGQAVAELRARGFDDDAEAVILSLH
jgi:hypothetical protein